MTGIAQRATTVGVDWMTSSGSVVNASSVLTSVRPELVEGCPRRA